MDNGLYPIVSLLRRAASHCIYVRKELLEPADSGVLLRLGSPTDVLNISTEAFERRDTHAPIYSCSATSSTPESVAISLSRAETELAESLGALSMVYTLVLGPDMQTLVDGAVFRTYAITLLRGIYRATPANVVSPVAPSSGATATFGPPDPTRVKF